MVKTFFRNHLFVFIKKSIDEAIVISNKKFKNKKNSLIDITKKYANNYIACIHFFIDTK